MSGEGGRGLTATPVALWLGWLLWLWQGFSLTWENSAKSEILAHHSAGNSGSQNPRRRRRCMKFSLAVCPYISKGEKKKVRVRRILARNFLPPGAGRALVVLPWQARCGGVHDDGPAGVLSSRSREGLSVVCAAAGQKGSVGLCRPCTDLKSATVACRGGRLGPCCEEGRSCLRYVW